MAATLLKKGIWHRCFPMNFAKFLKTPFSQNTYGRLLLDITVFKCWLLWKMKITCLGSDDECKEDVISYSTSEFISFIKINKVAVMVIVNDDNFELKKVSERIKCVKVTKSPTLFQWNTENEQIILGETVKFYLGNYFKPYNTVLMKLIKVRVEKSPDEIYSYRYCTYAKPKMNNLRSVRKFAEYVELPEILTRFYMKIKNCNCRPARQYGSELYTVHHL